MTRFHISATYRTRTGRVGVFSAIRIARDGSAALRWAERAIRSRRSYAGKLDARAIRMD